jgi:Fe-S-cluster containining protein
MGTGIRTCGDCIVCCVYQRINDPELKKDAMVHCPNLNLQEPITEGILQYTGASCENCKIYDTQPKMCGEYQCAWRYGYGSEEDRPDRSLMLFDCSHGIGNSVEAKPLKDGQERTTEGHAVIDSMSKAMNRPAIVLNFYERRIQRIVGRAI